MRRHVLIDHGARPSSKVRQFQHLIHTGLEPGDRWLREIRETVLTVSSSSRTAKLWARGSYVTAQTEKPLKRH